MAAPSFGRVPLSAFMEDTQFYTHTEALKAIGDPKDGRFGGIAIRFDTVNPEPANQQKDLHGEFFTKSTFFGSRGVDGVDVNFHHGIPLWSASDKRLSNETLTELADHRFAPLKATTTELGIFGEIVLDMSNEFEAMLAELGRADKLFFSSGADPMRVKVADTGEITSWPVVHMALTPTPAEPRNMMRSIKSLIEPTATKKDDGVHIHIHTAEPAKDKAMAEPTNNPTTDPVAAPEPVVAPVPAASSVSFSLDDMKTLLVDTQASTLAAVDERFKAFSDSLTPESRGTFTAPTGTAVLADTEHWKYDNTDTASLAVLINVLDAAGRKDRNRPPASDQAYKALAIRLLSDEGKKPVYHEGNNALKMFAHRHRVDISKPLAIKANEIGQSTLANFADEWVGVAYDSVLWESIRNPRSIVGMLNPTDWPWPGAESGVIPIDEGDITVFKVAQTTALSASPGGVPTGIVKDSQMNTGNVSATLVKLGARVLYTGELTEDAQLPFAATLKDNIFNATGEALESAVIDGDTETANTTNINDIAGQPAGTEYWQAFNGFRKIPLITSTAQSRSGGALTATDYMLTRRLLGTGGVAGLDRDKVFYIVDGLTWYKTTELPEVLTHDVFTGATLEEGQISRIFGSPLMVSAHMHLVGSFRQAGGLANASGLIDQDVGGNNTTGSILCVRPDRWRMYFRRRTTLEVTRVPYADVWDVVMYVRASLTNRDATTASSITYNVTV